MPKHKKRFNKNKIILLSCCAAVLVVALVVVLVRMHKSTPEPANVATSSSPADNNLNNARKGSSTPATTLDNGPSSTVNKTNSVSLTITRASVTNDYLQVGTLVSGTSSGTCTLSLSQSGEQTITSTNQVVQQNNSYVCPVFDIPLSQFPNQRDWNVSVNLSGSFGSTSSSWTDNPVNLSSTAP